MRYSLSIIYTTHRQKCELDWVIDSLTKQLGEGEKCSIIAVQSNYPPFEDGPLAVGNEKIEVLWTKPKPTIWSGEHRITSVDWWSKCNSLNTGISMCTTEWVVMLDDRCVLTEGWFQAIREAMDRDYAVCGSYEKRTGMRVENGAIIEPGAIMAIDGRGTEKRGCGPGWWFGCTGALPLEWVLECNGWPEDYADGLSFEDVLFGHLIDNNKHPIWYDPSMKIIEDRSPEFLGTPMRRTDKGVSPNDKSHRVLQIFQGLKTSGNSYNLRDLRELVLAGNPFPPPTASHRDWYDQSEIKDMV